MTIIVDMGSSGGVAVGMSTTIGIGHSGASSVLALLEEDEDSLKIFALEQMNANVDEFWFQLSGSISLIEALFEDEEFSHRELAALVASKVFYHLDDLDDALMYALGAGSLVDVSGGSDYSKTMLACCVDTYTSQRKVAAKEGKLADDGIDSRLLAIVERLFKQCVEDGQLEQAVGLAVESHRLDMLEEVISLSGSRAPHLVQYTLRAAQESVSSKQYRDDILHLLVRMHEKMEIKDVSSVIKCLIILDKPEHAGDILVGLIKGTKNQELMAYQIGFDVYEAENQSFTVSLRNVISKEFNIIKNIEKKLNIEDKEKEATETTGLMEDAAGTSTEDAHHPHDLVATRLDRILSGQIPMELERQFLARNNATDSQILKNIKATVEPRNSVCHGATVFANAMMNAGTTNDAFLRENLDWLAKATNWSKFSVTAGLGVIHKGNVKNSREYLKPYLPSSGAAASPYSEGGSLYALGLIHSNNGEGIKDYILDSLKNSQSEVIQHGACLGLGISGIGSEDSATFEEIKNILYNDNAVAGEAAGLAMGLLFTGSGSDLSEEMLAYAHDTQHEKIIRGLAIGLAAIQYGREEKADTMIEAMTLDQDAILRYGGMFAIGLAYCGTCDNSATQRLLHFAVSDVSNDVRRAAVLCIGFVMAGNPGLCVRAVSLLSESYNPHVRYGTCLAVGISGAGSGLKEASKLLESLWNDPVDFVMQGALIATAMVKIEQGEQSEFRGRLNKAMSTRGVDLMTRMGAIMANGILDAAGRNSTLSLHTDVGGLRRSSVLGLALFTQYWYWYPLSHTIALALKPTFLIGVDETLAPPVDFTLKCNTSPQNFALPAPVAVEGKKSKEKVPKAVLSTSRKKAEKAADEEKQEKEEGKGDDAGNAGEEMEVDDSTKEEGGVQKIDESSHTQEGGVSQYFMLKNPARVVPAQRHFMQFLKNERWYPIRGNRQKSGFVVLKNSKMEEPVEYVFEEKKAKEEKKNEGDEPPPPEPFEYVPS